MTGRVQWLVADILGILLVTTCRGVVGGVERLCPCRTIHSLCRSVVAILIRAQSRHIITIIPAIGKGLVGRVERLDPWPTVLGLCWLIVSFLTCAQS